MAEADAKAVAAAYRTINEADSETKRALDRLRKFYKQAGEDSAVGERAISEILESGPGAASRLIATADAVARLHGLEG